MPEQVPSNKSRTHFGHTDGSLRSVASLRSSSTRNKSYGTYIYPNETGGSLPLVSSSSPIIFIFDHSYLLDGADGSFPFVSSFLQDIDAGGFSSSEPSFRGLIFEATTFNRFYIYTALGKISSNKSSVVPILTEKNAKVKFGKTGKWKEHFSGTEILVGTDIEDITLEPGEYRLYFK